MSIVFLFVLTVVHTTLSILIPSERTMYTVAGLIAGDKVVEVITQSETAKKSLDLLHHKLDSMLEEYEDKNEQSEPKQTEGDK